jgi:serine/threonine protein kinase
MGGSVPRSQRLPKEAALLASRQPACNDGARVDYLSPLGPGDRLGPYTIVRRLGEGGMGVVYEATSEQGGRVALKVLSDWLVSEIGRQRFEREIQACAGLAHPNVVAIYDYGESEDGTLYYAMELLDGIDLGRLVELDGAQKAPRVVRILHQIAGALGVAHDKGLVHRDIKPPNLLLCESNGKPDVAKLVDFGLVMPMSPGQRLTLDGHVLGTPRYVAPEMLSARGVLGPATDLYALGLVAFYLLTGRHAFDGEGTADILKKQRDEAPPSLTALGVPQDLSSVVAWCLEKSPQARPKSAHTLREALAGCADMARWNEAEAAAWWDAWRSREISIAPPREERSGDGRTQG